MPLLAELDNSEHNREAGDVNDGEKLEIERGQGIEARIVADPQDGGLMILLQLQGDEEHAWIATGEHMQALIKNPAGIIIDAAVPANQPQIVMPDGGGKIITPN